MLLRMEKAIGELDRRTPTGYRIDSYHPARHHTATPAIYGEAFGDEPWTSEWHNFAEFDPEGAFVAVEGASGAGVGFVLCFQRNEYGYIAVVAVTPAHQRIGLSSALVAAAIAYLGSLGLETVRIDAWENSPPAVASYKSLGFTVYERRLEQD
jgi:ribosomal protein S18 acetylase RimI-like enzyme